MANQDLQIDRYKRLLEISRSINSKINLDELLTTITTEASNIIGADRATLFLLSEDKKELWSKVAEGLPGYYSEIRVPSDAGIVGAVVKSSEIINISDAYKDKRFNKEVDKKTGYKTKSILCVPIINRNGVMIGALQLLNKEIGVFTEDDENELSILCAQASVAIENASLYKEIEELFEELVFTIVLSLEYRDKTTAGHTQRVALYTLKTAHAIYEKAMDRFPEASYDGEKLKRLRYACLLHDIGKIGIDENVLNKRIKLNEAQLENLLNRIDKVITLEKYRDGNNAEKIKELESIKEFVKKHNTGQIDVMSQKDQDRMLAISKMAFTDVDGQQKPVMTEFEYHNLSITKGTLTTEEREHIKSHVLKSYEMLTQVKWPATLKELPLIAASHHESLDGTGYPLKLHDGEIPFDGKIMAIADIYDALAAADRPYKGPIPFDEIVRILRQEVERKHLDGRILDFFLSEKLYELTPDDFKRFKLSNRKGVPPLGKGK